MRLDILRLQRFRNLDSVEMRPHERFNLLVGDNGQGKTNLLEAIYLLSAARSFRSHKNAELVAFDADDALLEGRVDRGGHERIVRVEISSRGKDVYLNNSPVRQLSNFFGTLNVVLFGPWDLSLLKGSPSERRDFVDDAIRSAQPAYATELQHYEEALQQRNALLKEERPDEALLDVYGQQIVQYGSDVVKRRLAFMEEFRPVLQSVFREIFDPAIEADLHYDMKWAESLSIPTRPPDERSELESLLETALEETGERERDRGYTVVGPHRDDVAATLDGRDISIYGSQGQHRAFVLAMKIAVVTYLEDYYHFAPILLLDDVSSELDRRRNRRLFAYLRASTEGQIFVTTTHRDYIDLQHDLRLFEVDRGGIERVSDES
jgi:DNA replication and repair protein RecF